MDQLAAADAEVFETFVVPRYLSLFASPALELMLVGERSRLLLLGCRTGFPAVPLCQHVSGLSIVGLDPSPEALVVARKAAEAAGPLPIQFREGRRYPAEFPEGAFSHAMALSPLLPPGDWSRLLADLFRSLYAGGQALVSVPLHGSFQELTDLLREYALKHEQPEFDRLVEQAAQLRPTMESLSEDLEAVGLADVDIQVRDHELLFDSGRSFIEDPITRFMILPELQLQLGTEDLSGPVQYLREAIDKYWSEGRFSLTLRVGAASARR